MPSDEQMTLAGHKKAKPAEDKDAGLDRLCVYTIRMLSADMVDKAGSGHLGAPFGCAPLANALFGKIMKFSPRKRWMNRDRFVLSAGHASAMYYTMLHLTGNGLGGPYEVSMESLKQFRQAGSNTPGHPEFRMTSGVEVTTGPLGQGFANAVGMAIAEAHMSARFNRDGFPIFDHYTYVLAGDGCLMEGVSGEAASIAGHLKLHKLIVFYDDNDTTIDGHTDLAFTEDVAGVFAARNWNVLHMPCEDCNDSAVFEKIVEEAKSQTEKPTLVVMKTTIGAGAGKGLEGTSKAHGGKFPAATMDSIRKKWFSTAGLRQSDDKVDHLAAEVVEKELDDLYGWGVADKADVLPSFHVPRKVMDKFRNYGAKGDALADEWADLLHSYFSTFRDKEPELVKDLEDRMKGKYLTDNWTQALEEYLTSEQKRIDGHLKALLNDSDETLEQRAKRQKVSDSSFKHKAGRVCASEVLKHLVECNPSIIGGSADVASSCGGHFPNIQGHFLPPCYSSRIEGASYKGRFINFGIREHAALAILNGISSSSCLIPYSSLFTVFYQYGLPAIRMAAISKFPVLYIGTHDSIDLGEDGPTHQPVEVLPQLRAMPNLLVIRPANVDEMVGAFRVWAEQYDYVGNVSQYVDPKPMKRRPVFIMTSRGELGLPFRSNTNMLGQEGVKRGAYVLHDCFEDPHSRFGNARGNTPAKSKPLPDIVLIASGQDVALVLRTKELLLQWSKRLNEQLEGAFSQFPVSMRNENEPALLKVRVVSMPCWELFDEQDQDYQDSVLLSNCDDILRIYVEKAATKNTGHDKYAHFSVLMPSYGLSGKAPDVEKKLEFTPDFIAAKVWTTWADRGRRLPHAGDEADQGMNTWVSRLRPRVGSH
jgi:transketolase